MQTNEQHQLLALARQQLEQLYNQEPTLGLRQNPDVIFNDANRVNDLLTIFGMVSFEAAVTIIEFFFNQIKTTLGNGHLVGLEHHQLKKYDTFGTFDHHRSGESNDQDELGWGLMCATLMTGMGAALDLFVNVASVPIVVEPEVFEWIKTIDIRLVLQSNKGEKKVKKLIQKIIQKTAFNLDQNTLVVLETYLFNTILDPRFLETGLKLFNLFATEESLDADQDLASRLLVLAGNQTLDSVSTFLDKHMPTFLQEEFGIHCFGSDLSPISETINKINEQRSQTSKPEFEMPNYSARVIMPSEKRMAELAPIVIIEVQLNALPVNRGYWNHIVAKIVDKALSQRGLSNYHESGVVTCVLHSPDLLTDKTKCQLHEGKPVYGPERLVKTERCIIGVSSRNKKHWSKQYAQNELAITTHEKIARLFATIFPPHPVRNLLIASQKSPNEKVVPKPPREVSHKQLGWRKVEEELGNLGYLVATAAAV